MKLGEEDGDLDLAAAGAPVFSSSFPACGFVCDDVELTHEASTKTVPDASAARPARLT